MTASTPPCRLWVVMARRAPVAVILRRGPAAWYHVILWNTVKDSFEHGAWMRSRIYEDKCALSPDGELFVYFVHQGSRSGTPFTHAWTAVSRLPWLHALGVVPQGTTYGGGGWFLDDRTVTIAGRHSPLVWPKGLAAVDWTRGYCGDDRECVEGAEWSGYDHAGHAIFTEAGKLYRRHNEGDVALADFNGLTPDPQPAPAWARVFPKPGKRRR